MVQEVEANKEANNEPLMVVLKTNDMAEEINMIEEKNHKENAEVVVAMVVDLTNTKDMIVSHPTKSRKFLNQSAIEEVAVV